MGIASLLFAAIAMLFSCQDAYGLKCFECSNTTYPCPFSYVGLHEQFKAECTNSSKYCVKMKYLGKIPKTFYLNTRNCSTPEDEKEVCSQPGSETEIVRNHWLHWCCDTDFCNTGASLVSGLPVLIGTFILTICVAKNLFV